MKSHGNEADIYVICSYEFFQLWAALSCHRGHRLWSPAPPVAVLSHVSHLTLIVSSGLNFVIYSLVGHTFRRSLHALTYAPATSPAPAIATSPAPSLQRVPPPFEMATSRTLPLLQQQD